MSIIREKYELIAPTLDYLSDKVILAQAWKKSIAHIRRHNWYTDPLELDISTINLEDNLTNWSVELQNQFYKPTSMRLVLAPKNKEWVFKGERDDGNDSSEWSCVGEQPLRALAHLNIQDQTISTATMLCLANAVETAQGPTTENDFFVAQSQNVFSYGNRLYCEWEMNLEGKQIANFGWGNSQCYRQFFEDYQQFLKRPRTICETLQKNLESKKKLYVVSLDIQKFYDHIDRKILIKKLETLYEEYTINYDKENLFWNDLENIFKWTWEDEDKTFASYIKDEDEVYDDGEGLPTGIPQGLVAGGFFANAYLIAFDRYLGGQIGKDISEILNEKKIDFRLHDYCRYVDDIRLVIEIDDKPEGIITDIYQIIPNFINKQLKQHFKKATNFLTVNPKKTKIQPYEQLSSNHDISARMNMIQGKVSKTFDLETLEQVSGELDGLLRLSEQLFEERKDNNSSQLQLAFISNPNIDVKNDTLKRFAATRIVKILQEKKRISSNNSNEKFNQENLLEHEFESVSRKLISVWAHNPSLSLLLKCALDLYPSLKVLQPVLEALEYKLFKEDKNIKENKAIEYVVADLFYAASVRIGYHKTNSYTKSININSFREELASLAEKIMNNQKKFSWYLKQQSCLFLASIDKNIDIDSENDFPKELKYYNLLHHALKYKSNIKNIEKRLGENEKIDIIDYFTVALVVQQIVPNIERFTNWFFLVWDQIEEKNKKKSIIKILLSNRSDILKNLINSNKMEKNLIKELVPIEIQHIANLKEDIVLKNNIFIHLIDVIHSEVNPFQQENAVLNLFRELLKHKTFKQNPNSISINNIRIKCENWNDIQNLNKSNLITLMIDPDIDNSLINSFPEWIEDSNEWKYNIGKILRSCIIGEYDFTTNAFLIRNDSNHYKGLRSTSFSRQLGMSNKSQTLFSDPFPISPWLIELLFILLQWPGTNFQEQIMKFDNKDFSILELTKAVKTRVDIQKKIFGKLSNIPMYSEPVVNKSTMHDNLFRVAIVQTLMPKFDDFDSKNPLSWNKSFREKHRNHLASTCKLIAQHLNTSKSATNDKFPDAESPFNIDLIIFPELSVHEDDLDILQKLSDETHSSIFAGTCFTKTSTHDQPINQAIWLLRSEERNVRKFTLIWQGKQHMTKDEIKLNIKGFRPYQMLIDFAKSNDESIRVTGAICYDATDLSLAADLRDISDVFVVIALNHDIETFDNMVSALHYHMYQPVILVNTGEFGGSTVKAPFTKYNKTITQIHGNEQLAVSIFEIDPSLFKTIKKTKTVKPLKTPPAGYKGR